MSTKEAHRRAVLKFNKDKTEFVGVRLNKNTDADILEKLASVENKQGYIKQLIRADIQG